MIKSMTGFGRAEVMEENRKFTVEIKSVNHRYFDVNIKMPKKLGFFESTIRNLLKEYMQRGKVDVFITYEDYNENNVALKYNEEIAREYLTHLNAMAEQFDLQNDITVGKLSKYPDEMLKNVDFIEERSPQILSDYRSRLEAKVKELLEDTQIDDGRIAAEVTIYADKICVDEETVRLRSHIQGTKDALEEGGSIGRKLDFIAQEMNREANTILSKANDLAISDTGIELKTNIEKVRDQIQNIE